jgi:hypothetical protein
MCDPSLLHEIVALRKPPQTAHASTRQHDTQRREEHQLPGTMLFSVSHLRQPSPPTISASQRHQPSPAIHLHQPSPPAISTSHLHQPSPSAISTNRHHSTATASNTNIANHLNYQSHHDHRHQRPYPSMKTAVSNQAKSRDNTEIATDVPHPLNIVTATSVTNKPPITKRYTSQRHTPWFPPKHYMDSDSDRRVSATRRLRILTRTLLFAIVSRNS